MIESKIEAMIASPPDRDELIAQLFVKDGAQWAEVYRDQGKYWIEIFVASPSPMRFEVTDFIRAISVSQNELRDRLEANSI